MDKKKKKKRTNNNVVAPGIDPDESYGQDAEIEDIENEDYTTVTRLVYDEYDPSEKQS